MTMRWLQDSDFVLWQGDVVDVLDGEIASDSIDCCITSPPYWGLRDYGTGGWSGGGADCDHAAAKRTTRFDYSLEATRANPHQVRAQTTAPEGTDGRQWHSVCPTCGARRVDAQLGLEATPEEYVSRLVDVFREVWRVLAPHGSVWLNLGDSYSGATPGRNDLDRIGQRVTDPNPTTPPTSKYTDDAQRQRRGARSASGLPAKNLVGIPWRVAFALQRDGWLLRSDTIWAKPNPIPESVADRPTKSHEYVFLLAKQPRYWFDQAAVAERAISGTDLGLLRGRIPDDADDRVSWHADSIAARQRAGVDSRTGNPSATRNVRSVWSISAQPYAHAHFATYPTELVRRCLLASCPQRVCLDCGQPDGWSDCDHDSWRPGVVLDPFIGSGTTALVARRHTRACVGIELNPAYCHLIEHRLQQLALDGAEYEPPLVEAVDVQESLWA